MIDTRGCHGVSAIIDERLIFKLRPIETASKIVIGIEREKKYEKKDKSEKRALIRAKRSLTNSQAAIPGNRSGVRRPRKGVV